MRSRALRLAALAALITVPAVAMAQTLNGHPDLRGVWWPEGAKDGTSAAIKPVDGKPLPFTPQGRKLLATSGPATKAEATPSGPNDMRRCLPFGPTRILTQDYPVEIVQSGDTFIIIYEHNHVYETIYMGAKPNPDLDPAYMGASVGRWTRDGVAIDSANFNDQTVLDDLGTPHSDQLKVTRTLRRIDDGKRLEILATVTDPIVFTHPVTLRYVLAARPAESIQEYTCGQGPTLETRYTRALPPAPDPAPEPMMRPGGGPMAPGGGGPMGSGGVGPMAPGGGGRPDAQGPMLRPPLGSGAPMGAPESTDGPRRPPPGDGRPMPRE